MKPNQGIQSWANSLLPVTVIHWWAESQGANPHPLNGYNWSWDDQVAEVYQGKMVPSWVVSVRAGHRGDGLSMGMEAGGADQAGSAHLHVGGEDGAVAACLLLPSPSPSCLAMGGHLLCWLRGGRGEAGMDIKVRMPQAWEMELGFQKQLQTEGKPLVLK